MHRKTSRFGQIQQLFVILAAILVMVAIIFIGIKLMGGLVPSACNANNALFQQEMKDRLDENALYGNKNIVSVSPACDATMLCFVDYRDIGNTGFTGRLTDPTIVASVKAGVKTNIFLNSGKAMLDEGYDERIVFSKPVTSPAWTSTTNAKCFNLDSSGKFKFKVTGGGQYIVVEDP